MQLLQSILELPQLRFQTHQGFSPVSELLIGGFISETLRLVIENKGHDPRLLQDFMGHRAPRHTSRYTRTASRRFEGLWKEPRRLQG